MHPQARGGGVAAPTAASVDADTADDMWRPRPNAEDESIRDLRKAILAQVPDASPVPREASTPEALRPRSELLDPDLGRLRDVAQPGGFRRHHVRQQGSAESQSNRYVHSSLLQLLDPGLALSFLEEEPADQAGSRAWRAEDQDVHAVAADGASSNLATAIIIAKMCFGSAVLIVPRGFRSAGVILGPAMLILVYVLMISGMLRLIRCRQTRAGKPHYQDLGVALGPWGRGYLTFGLVALVYGFDCIWCVTCQENIKMLLPEWGSTQRLWIFYPLVVPLCFVRKLRVFTITNLLGVALCFSTWVYLTCFAAGRLVNAGIQPVTLVNTANLDSLLWLGTCGYIFELIAVVIPVYEAAADKEAMPKLLVSITALILALYIGFGCLFYLAFGEETGDLALLNLPRDSIAGFIFPLFFSIVGLVTMPLNFFVIFQSYEPSFTWSDNYHVRKWKKNAVRALVAMSAYAVTWAGGEQLQNFLALVGGLLGSNLALNMPALLHIVICKPKGLALAWDVLTSVLGIAIMLTSTYQAVVTWK